MTQEDKLREKTDEIVDGRVQDAPKADPTPDPDSPLAEARKLKADFEKLADDIKGERLGLENMRAEMQLAGKGWAGQKPKSQEEIDQEEADEIIKNYT